MLSEEFKGVVFVVFVLAIAFLALRRSTFMSGKFLALFRSLFPSWRFFSDVTQVPTVHYRFSSDGGIFSSWKLGLKKPVRKWYSLIVNHHGNLYLASHTLLQQLESDIGELSPQTIDRFENSVSFQLTKNLVRYLVVNQEGLMVTQEGLLVTPEESKPNLFYQFKVSRARQGSDGSSSEDFLISKVFRL